MSEPRTSRHRTHREQSETTPRSGASTARGGLGAALSNLATLHAQALLATLGQLSRRPLATLMTVAVIAIALAMPAGLHLLLKNGQRVVNGWEGASQISLFLKSEVSEARGRALTTQLQQRSEIASSDYISRDTALAEFRQHSGFGEALGALEENPLPAVIVLQPHAAAATPQQMEQLLDELRKRPEVELAQLDMEWLKRLFALMEMVQRGVVVLASLLALGVLLVIGNTIRLAIQNRRDEIVIIKLIGASDAFIRRPFLYTGFWYGFGGALLALLLVQGALLLLKGPVHTLALLYNSSFSLSGIDAPTTLLILAIGALLGLFGAWIAVGRHLREIEPS